ncbi:DUF4238 domain-containing protein [Erwinia aphidicola]|uniref:DUF4238 domain-containing protein n=1 Tax=Erwinia aphidicola TaxID=68334 RepID=UPI0030196C0C
MEFVDIKNKKKQHYVPQFYLKKWLSEEEIWVSLTIDGRSKKFLKKTTSDIAVENYFYKIKMDDVVWDLLMARYMDEIKESPLLQMILKDLHFLKCADDVINKGWLVTNHDKKTKEFAKKNLKTMNNIFFENKYSEIESSLSEIIKDFIRLQESQIVTLTNSKTLLHIIIFYSAQLFRTKKMYSTLAEKITNLVLKRGNEEIILNEDQKESYFRCILYIMSLQFALNFEEKVVGIKVFKNNTGINFLTSDCPAIYNNDSTFAAIPLSPNLFIHFDLRDPTTLINTHRSIKIEKIELNDVEQVKITNRLISENSNIFIFSQNEKDFITQP